MKLSTIIIGLLLLSLLFITACQTSVQEDKEQSNDGKSDIAQNQEQQTGEGVDLIPENEVDIGELI